MTDHAISGQQIPKDLTATLAKLAAAEEKPAWDAQDYSMDQLIERLKEVGKTPWRISSGP